MDTISICHLAIIAETFVTASAVLSIYTEFGRQDLVERGTTQRLTTLFGSL